MASVATINSFVSESSIMYNLRFNPSKHRDGHNTWSYPSATTHHPHQSFSDWASYIGTNCAPRLFTAYLATAHSTRLLLIKYTVVLHQWCIIAWYCTSLSLSLSDYHTWWWTPYRSPLWITDEGSCGTSVLRDRTACRWSTGTILHIRRHVSVCCMVHVSIL